MLISQITSILLLEMTIGRNCLKRAFANKNSVQESFRRLYPIRLATMHARTITQDDELYLYVETKRILAAIGITI